MPPLPEQLTGGLSARSLGRVVRRREVWGALFPPAARPLALVLSPSSEPGSGCCDTRTARAEERQAVSGLYTLTAGMFSFWGIRLICSPRSYFLLGCAVNGQEGESKDVWHLSKKKIPEQNPLMGHLQISQNLAAGR